MYVESTDEIMYSVVEALADEFDVPYALLSGGADAVTLTDVEHHRLDELGLDEDANLRLVTLFHGLIGRAPNAAQVRALQTLGDVVHLVEGEMLAVIAMRSCSALELRVGFDVGLYTRVDVEAWVERRILEEESPAAPLLDLATLSHRSDSEIASLLDGLVPEKSVTFALYVQTVARMFYAKRLSARAALEVLCGQASYQGSTAEEEVLRLEVNMDLVAQGIMDVSDAEDEIAEFLARSTNAPD